jgi:hypothetical protein
VRAVFAITAFGSAGLLALAVRPGAIEDPRLGFYGCWLLVIGPWCLLLAGLVIRRDPRPHSFRRGDRRVPAGHRDGSQYHLLTTRPSFSPTMMCRSSSHHSRNSSPHTTPYHPAGAPGFSPYASG